jgi:hypothetical protein
VVSKGLRSIIENFENIEVAEASHSPVLEDFTNANIAIIDYGSSYADLISTIQMVKETNPIFLLLHLYLKLYMHLGCVIKGLTVILKGIIHQNY